MVYKGIWGTTTHCKPSKPNSCHFQTLVDNPLTHNIIKWDTMWYWDRIIFELNVQIFK